MSYLECGEDRRFGVFLVLRAVKEKRRKIPKRRSSPHSKIVYARREGDEQGNFYCCGGGAGLRQIFRSPVTSSDGSLTSAALLMQPNANATPRTIPSRPPSMPAPRDSPSAPP